MLKRLHRVTAWAAGLAKIIEGSAFGCVHRSAAIEQRRVGAECHTHTYMVSTHAAADISGQRMFQTYNPRLSAYLRAAALVHRTDTVYPRGS